MQQAPLSPNQQPNQNVSSVDQTPGGIAPMVRPGGLPTQGIAFEPQIQTQGGMVQGNTDGIQRLVVIAEQNRVLLQDIAETEALILDFIKKRARAEKIKTIGSVVKFLIITGIIIGGFWYSLNLLSTATEKITETFSSNGIISDLIGEKAKPRPRSPGSLSSKLQEQAKNFLSDEAIKKLQGQ